MPDGERKLPRRVDRDRVHATLVPAECAEYGPVARAEDRERAVLGRREEVRAGGEAEVRDRACVSRKHF